jgi:hypothetical protein
MHGALTTVQVSVTRTPVTAMSVRINIQHAHWLATFSGGLLIITTRKRIVIEKSFSDALILVYLFWHFILWWKDKYSFTYGKWYGFQSILNETELRVFLSSITGADIRPLHNSKLHFISQSGGNKKFAMRFHKILRLCLWNTLFTFR